jgi:hypothetical protein
MGNLPYFHQWFLAFDSDGSLISDERAQLPSGVKLYPLLPSGRGGVPEAHPFARLDEGELGALRETLRYEYFSRRRNCNRDFLLPSIQEMTSKEALNEGFVVDQAYKLTSGFRVSVSLCRKGLLWPLASIEIDGTRFAVRSYQRRDGCLERSDAAQALIDFILKDNQTDGGDCICSGVPLRGRLMVKAIGPMLRQMAAEKAILGREW